MYTLRLLGERSHVVACAPKWGSCLRGSMREASAAATMGCGAEGSLACVFAHLLEATGRRRVLGRRVGLEQWISYTWNAEDTENISINALRQDDAHTLRRVHALVLELPLRQRLPSAGCFWTVRSLASPRPARTFLCTLCTVWCRVVCGAGAPRLPVSPFF